MDTPPRVSRRHTRRTSPTVIATAPAKDVTVRTWFHGTHSDRYSDHRPAAPGDVGSTSSRASLHGMCTANVMTSETTYSPAPTRAITKSGFGAARLIVCIDAIPLAGGTSRKPRMTNVEKAK